MSLTEAQICTTLRPHTGRFGSPIARLHNTGEITEHTVLALRNLASDLLAGDQDEPAAQVEDVVEYVVAVGCRPPVERWGTRS